MGAVVREDIAQAIKQKNMAGAMRLMLEGRPPQPRVGFHQESELWDYKRDCPRRGAENANGWATTAADVLAFHNNRGGLIFFGFDDRSFAFRGATTILDSKMVNDQLRRYLPDNIYVEYSREYIQDDQTYLGVLLVPPRGPVPARFRTGAPLVAGKRLFEKAGAAIRRGDSSHILGPDEAESWIRSLRVPVVGNTHAVDKPHYRILSPDYEEFIERPDLGRLIEMSLRDPRTAVTSLVGLGGMGKTALATWATLRAYDTELFEFIVSLTAKDRELTSTGIIGLEKYLTSYERLLDEILEVLQFADLKPLPIHEKEEQVRLLIGSGRGLLYVDNLETVDDARVIQFLDDLPVGTRAILTSRRSRVRVAVRPVDIPQMTDAEIAAFVTMLAKQPAFRHVAGITPAEAARVGSAWNGIPLAIRWALSRSSSPAQAIAAADAATAVGAHGEELLEFSFRRVFESLEPVQRQILQVLAILQQPIPIEAVAASTGGGSLEVIDSLDDLVTDSLVMREFDTLRNDYSYTLLPITRAFVRHDMRSQVALGRRITKQLTEWFEAYDVKSTDERLVVRQLRQGGVADDSALLDLATAAERDGRLETAEKIYKQALSRTPGSWRAARQYAEFLRHARKDRTGALRLYTQAVANAPSPGDKRALIYREYGILLRDSGEPDPTNKAADALREAVAETPNDDVAVGALAQVLERKGSSREIIALLEPHRTNGSRKFRSIADPILLRAYERTSEILKAAELKRRVEEQDS